MTATNHVNYGHENDGHNNVAIMAASTNVAVIVYPLNVTVILYHVAITIMVCGHHSTGSELNT